MTFVSALIFFRKENSMLIRLPLPQCFGPRGGKLRPWSEKNSDQNPDHPRLCIYQEKEKLRPWSEFLGRENSDHGLSLACFGGRGRRALKNAHKLKKILGTPAGCPWNSKRISLIIPYRFLTGTLGKKRTRTGCNSVSSGFASSGSSFDNV